MLTKMCLDVETYSKAFGITWFLVLLLTFKTYFYCIMLTKMCLDVETNTIVLFEESHQKQKQLRLGCGNKHELS